MPITLLIADDHEVVRTGLKSLFAGSDIEVVAEAATGEAAVRMVLEHNPDVVLLDIRMPEGDGLNALGRIKLERPDMPVLILSTYDNPTYVARVGGLGRQRIHSQGNHSREPAASDPHGRRRANLVDPRRLRRVTGALATPRLAADVEVPLTQRESEVLRQLAFGLTNKEIALALHISYETVKEHVQHILRKIGVSDRTQAAVWAVRKGLV